MRRLFLPVILLAVVAASSVLAAKSNSAADPGHAISSSSESARVVTPLFSARRTPEWLRRPTADTMLGRAIQTVLARPSMPVTRCVTVHRDGIEVARNDVGDLFHPGALQRLITAAAATEVVAPEAVFRTEAVVRTDAVVDEEGVLDGDIWLIGGGDPVLATSEYVSRFDTSRPFTDLDQLADTVAAQLAADGITEITGTVMGDESKYTPAERDYVGEETPFGDVWTREENAGNAVGPMSALMVNDGFTAWPEEFDQTQNTRAIDPATAAAKLFATLLAERGIVTANGSGNSIAPQGAERRTLGGIESPPFAEILSAAILPGGATASEMILKEIGVRSGVTALRANAILFGEAVILARAGLPVAGTAIADGSGLSSLNRTTCDLLVSLLDEHDNSSPLLEAIPSAESGPFAACSSESDRDLRLLASAEPGTSALAGRYVATNGDQVTFVMIINDDPIEDEESDTPETEAAPELCNVLQRALVDAVSAHPYGPDLDKLAPLPAELG